MSSPLCDFLRAVRRALARHKIGRAQRDAVLPRVVEQQAVILLRDQPAGATLLTGVLPSVGRGGGPPGDCGNDLGAAELPNDGRCWFHDPAYILVFKIQSQRIFLKSLWTFFLFSRKIWGWTSW